jgi:hypothetical protein
MSQRIWKRGDTEVRMGYDRPLDYVFCTVMIRGEVAYTNLADEEAGTECQRVDYYREPLAALGIAVPEEMFRDIKLDRGMKIGGNKVVEY